MRTEYLYDLGVLDRTLNVAKTSSDNFGFNLHYALKSNNNERILGEVSKYLNVDCVSKEEINLALNYWDANQIVFAGSGKSRDEINYALGINIKALHIESVNEFLYAKEIKEKIDSETLLVLRLNIDIATNTHKKISTGEKHHKFGIDSVDVVSLIRKYPDYISGIHSHAGSQITDTSWFVSYANAIKTFLNKLPKGFQLDYLNMGGGLGIDYENYTVTPDFMGWMQNIRSIIPKSIIEEIHLEPGRSIVGQCGKIVAQVQWIKNKDFIDYAILDVGMSDILRPALYDARHCITSVNYKNKENKNYIIFGPSCESSDVFGEYLLPKLKEEDYVEIHSAGAYVESMRLDYNLRTKIPTSYV